jgi:hypothetical protein
MVQAVAVGMGDPTVPVELGVKIVVEEDGTIVLLGGTVLEGTTMVAEGVRVRVVVLAGGPVGVRVGVRVGVPVGRVAVAVPQGGAG